MFKLRLPEDFGHKEVQRRNSRITAFCPGVASFFLCLYSSSALPWLLGSHLVLCSWEQLLQRWGCRIAYHPAAASSCIVSCSVLSVIETEARIFLERKHSEMECSGLPLQGRHQRCERERPAGHLCSISQVRLARMVLPFICWIPHMSRLSRNLSSHQNSQDMIYKPQPPISSVTLGIIHSVSLPRASPFWYQGP